MTTRELPQDMQHAMITSWPNTPGPQALVDLANRLEAQGKPDSPQGPPLTEGINSYVERLDAQQFRRRAHSSWNSQDTTDPQLVIEALTRIALHGDTSNTIGLAVLQPPRNLLKLIPWFKPRSRCSFSRLPRHPRWMGFDPTLSMVSGLTALVVQGNDDQPSIVLALPPRMTQILPENTRHTFPQGQASTLAALLQWHGALPVWTPRKEPEEKTV